jgi:uncharacterized protein with PIN domain
MPKASISFRNDLNDLLHRRNKSGEVNISFKGDQSIKHIIESLGVPHTEIGLIETNQQFVDFNYLVRTGDVIIVHPATPENDSLSGLFDKGKLTIEPRFILDNHLGKLATYLRILGFDAVYRNDYQDDELAQTTVELNRILLSRDHQLLMRKSIRYGYLIRSRNPENQVAEIIRRFNLSKQVTPFHRCLRCNTLLEAVEKQSILHLLEPKTKKYYQEFHICPNCKRVYWKGSHYERMDKLIKGLVSSAEEDAASN